MNLSLISKLIPLAANVVSTFTKGGIKSKATWLAAALVLFGGLQAAAGDFLAFLGPWGQVASAVVGAVVLILQSVVHEQPKS